MMAQTPKSKPEAHPVMARKLSTVPAAWPTGMSQLTQAYAACRRCDVDETCGDWLEHTGSIRLPPEFCPNADELTGARKRK